MRWAKQLGRMEAVGGRARDHPNAKGREKKRGPPTRVKFCRLARHGRRGVLQLVGAHGGAAAVHAAGGHVRPVGGGRVILAVLVLAKARVCGIFLRREQELVTRACGSFDVPQSPLLLVFGDPAEKALFLRVLPLNPQGFLKRERATQTRAH